MVFACRVDRDTVLWRVDTGKPGVSSRTFECHSSSAAALSIAETGLEGAETVLRAHPVSAADDAAVQEALLRFPHLNGCTALRLQDIPSDDELAACMQSQLCMCTLDDGAVSSVTGVQVQGVLDSEYAPCPLVFANSLTSDRVMIAGTLPWAAALACHMADGKGSGWHPAS